MTEGRPSLPNSIITWNGISSDTLNITIERFPNIIRGSRKFEQVSVPGRNGDLFFYENAWNNYDQQYEIYAGTGVRGNAPETFRNIASWFFPESTSPTIEDYANLTLNGYHQLTDSYEPDCIRLAAVTNGMDVTNAWNMFGQTTLTFNCRPERFTLDAFDVIEETGTFTLTNPTDRNAKPLIKLYGRGTATDVTIVINSKTITLLDFSDYIYIDFESQNCFRLLAENRNNKVQIDGDFPVLVPGENTFSGNVTKWEIIPRWWKL